MRPGLDFGPEASRDLVNYRLPATCGRLGVSLRNLPISLGHPAKGQWKEACAGCAGLVSPATAQGTRCKSKTDGRPCNLLLFSLLAFHQHPTHAQDTGRRFLFLFLSTPGSTPTGRALFFVFVFTSSGSYMYFRWLYLGSTSPRGSTLGLGLGVATPVLVGRVPVPVNQQIPHSRTACEIAKRTKQQEQEQQEAQLSYKDLVSHSPANEHANEQEAT